jgi:hypothetical protein
MILQVSRHGAESMGSTVAKLINELRRRKGDRARPISSRPSNESFDERYEIVDAGAFWDETAEVLAPRVRATG